MKGLRCYINHGLILRGEGERVQHERARARTCTRGLLFRNNAEEIEVGGRVGLFAK